MKIKRFKYKRMCQSAYMNRKTQVLWLKFLVKVVFDEIEVQST